MVGVVDRLPLVHALTVVDCERVGEADSDSDLVTLPLTVCDAETQADAVEQSVSVGV